MIKRTKVWLSSPHVHVPSVGRSDALIRRDVDFRSHPHHVTLLLSFVLPFGGGGTKPPNHVGLWDRRVSNRYATPLPFLSIQVSMALTRPAMGCIYFIGGTNCSCSCLACNVRNNLKVSKNTLGTHCSLVGRWRKYWLNQERMFTWRVQGSKTYICNVGHLYPVFGGVGYSEMRKRPRFTYIAEMFSTLGTRLLHFSYD